eukprot:EG_transcript_45827
MSDASTNSETSETPETPEVPEAPEAPKSPTSSLLQYNEEIPTIAGCVNPYCSEYAVSDLLRASATDSGELLVTSAGVTTIPEAEAEEAAPPPANSQPHGPAV